MTRPVPFLFPPKSVGSTLDYGLSWQTWLEPGDSIVSYAITATPSGLTISTPTLTIANGEIVVSAFVGGGTANTSYELLLSVTTAHGLTDVEAGILNVLSF